jgi:hypothetical protein
MADFKYLIRATEYYRNLLKSEVKKTEMTMEKPDLINGLEMLNPKSIDQISKYLDKYNIVEIKNIFYYNTIMT